jgi:DNA-binding response OmpR family regulator
MIELPVTMASRSEPRKVLLVDDSEICCDYVRLVLEGFGYAVITMNSHFGFVKTLRDDKPDLVLVDVTMPIMSGTKLVELALKKRTNQCSIVLYSDRDESELAGLAASCGADGYIKKTSNDMELFRSVSRYISARVLKA